MHSAATVKKADSIYLNCYLLFSEWGILGHTSTKDTYLTQFFLKHKHVQDIIRNTPFFVNMPFPFLISLLIFSAEWQNKAMLCSLQGYFHSGTSFRVVTCYSSTIKIIKIKNWFLVLPSKIWKTEFPTIFLVSLWAKNNNSKSLAYIIEEGKDNESNACVYITQCLHSTVTDFNANAIFHNIYSMRLTL